MPRVAITRCDCPLDRYHRSHPYVVTLDWGRIVDHHESIEAAYQSVRPAALLTEPALSSAGRGPNEPV